MREIYFVTMKDGGEKSSLFPGNGSGSGSGV